MAPNGVTRSLETGNGADTNKRFLRNDRDAGEDDDIDNSSDNNDADEEERAKGKNLFAESKLSEMQSSVKTFKRFKNWKAYGLSPGTVATRLENKGIYDQYKDLYHMYQKYYTTL
ncbi:RxLR effector protein [Phytophthora megakarya]|uniref:RxLR effector protein n=1 Tax=Phytophthora megakarya TaxID=4795 RepID=A0A225UKX9_9STRA|nr:RxLR effector protein [Phytophthora megakarya]